MAKHTDSAVLENCITAASRGDSEAFEQLYRCASGAVYAYALSLLKNSHDAEDVLHDCFLNIYHAAADYVPHGKPMAWILTIVRNLCLRRLQQRNRREDIPTEDWERYLAEKESLSAEDRLSIRACMKMLRDDEREIVLLHAAAGFKHREIAGFMGLPLPTVLSKYSRAIKKLRNILEKESL